MKKFICLILSIVFIICLGGCNRSQPAVENNIQLPSTESGEPLDETVLETPPELTVLYNETSVNALKGTSSWTYKEEDGNFVSINADSMHPLNAKEYMPSLKLLPSQFSHIDPNAAYLYFEVIPDEVTVRCWSEESWGNPNAKSEEVDVYILMFDSSVDVPNFDSDTEIPPSIHIELKDGNYIYEVMAKWDSRELYGGTALYSFSTFKPNLVIGDQSTILKKVLTN